MLSRWSAIIIVLASAGVPACAQDTGRDPRKTIERYQAYLARKPFHDWAFDKLVEAAVSINGLDGLVEEYEARIAEEPEDQAATVVLARLYARTEQGAKGLERARGLLTSVDSRSKAHLLELIGQLHLREGQAARAAEMLEQAAAATKDPKHLGRINQRLGEAALTAGQREKATAAFRAMAALTPKNFNTRLEVAMVFARHGMSAEALEEFGVAEALAGKDAAKRCRVLSEKGRLYECSIQVPEALAVYREAIALMRRGNWLKRDLYERILALHQRSGQLDALLASARADVQQDPQDLDAREFLARVLRAREEPAAAREVLEAAVREFADDLTLSRTLLALLREEGLTDALIVEYQRTIERHPHELDLYLELGKVFASAGRLQQAKRQWDRSLQKRLKDPSLCVKLAELYGFYAQPEEAVRLYRKAIELEPRNMATYASLAAYLVKQERAAEVPALLEEATARAEGDASRLEQVSRLWQERGQAQRARTTLEAALALKPGDSRLLLALADLQLELNAPTEAQATLRQVIDTSSDSTVRGAAVDKVIRIASKADALEALVTREERAVAAGDRDLAPYLLLARVRGRARQPRQAIDVLEKLLVIHPQQEDAHRQLGRLRETQGEFDEALAHYQALAALSPQLRRRYLKEIAEVHLALFEQSEAFACYEEILRASPNNPAAFKEVAAAYKALGMLEKARDCLLQAVRLEPELGRHRLDLALIYQALGDGEKARAEIQAAVNDDDEQVREEARARSYELLAESGGLDDAVEALRARVETNPYDVEAPLTLTDIYIRELEYELALELLEKLISYQPKEQRLIAERARIRFLMEQYGAAIADYETLWKLPQSHKQDLALQIAEAALEAGDQVRAARALESVDDALEVAELYRDHDLIKEAVGALEEGVARDPRGVRLHQRLSSLRASMGDREGAAEALERVIDLQGERWETVQALGDLQFQLGRKAEALAWGKRLFQLMRAQSPSAPTPKSRRSKPSGAAIGSWRRSLSGSSSRTSARNSQFTARLRSLQSYFTGKGLRDELLALLEEEVTLQPTNAQLLMTTLSLLNRSAKGEENPALELLRRVQGLTVAAGKHPPDQTAQEWADQLDALISTNARRTSKIAMARGEALSALVASGQAKARDHIERVQVLDFLREAGKAREALEAGLAAFPAEPHLLLAKAQRLFADRNYAEAEPLLARAVQAIEAARDSQQEAREDELAYRKQRQGLLNAFPAWLRGRVSEDHLRRLHRLTGVARIDRSTGWGLGVRPSASGARLLQLKCLVKLERRDEAAAVLKALEPDDPDVVQDWVTLSRLAYDEGFQETTERITRRLQQLERSLERDPVLGHNRNWAGKFAGPMNHLARILEKRGEYFEAYDLLRTYGKASAGELVLTTHDAMDAVAARYRERVEQAAAQLDAGEDDAAEAYRDAGIKLAELQQSRKRWAEVLKLYQAMSERLPDDFSLSGVIAQLHVRAGRYDEAIAVHYRVIERKRELNRQPQRERAPEGRRVNPLPPPNSAERREDWVWRNLRSSGWRGGARRRHSLNSDYAGILKIHLNRREISKAAELMRRLAREDVMTFRWMGYALGQLIRNHRMGAKGVPILRLLHSYNRNDTHVALQFARALISARKQPEAIKVLQAIVSKGRGNGYAEREAQKELARLQISQEGPRGVDALRRDVEDDPKNLKKRQRLAQQLYADRRFEEALAEARILSERAPHLPQVKTLLFNCLQVLGKRDEVADHLREQIVSARREEQKFALALQLANHHLEAGMGPKVEEALTMAKLYQGTQYSLANWLMEKGFFERARTCIEEELKGSQQNTFNTDTLKRRLTRLQFVLGDPLAALDLQYQKLLEVPTRAGKTAAFRTLAGVLRLAPNVKVYREAVMAAAAKHAGLRGDLYRAAYHLAARELDQAEEVLEAARVREPEETEFLERLRVDFALSRGDVARALELLEASETKAAGANATAAARSAFRQEKAGLLMQLGRKVEALEIYREIYDDSTSSGLRSLAGVYAANDMLEEAIAAWRRYFEREGERGTSDLEQLASLLLKQERFAEALAVLERAVILAPEGGSTRGRLRQRVLAVYRAQGRLAEYRQKLGAALRQDPDDLSVLARLARVAAEQGDDAAVVETLERMATKPGGGQRALGQLAAHYQVVGDLTKAEELLRRLLDAEDQNEWNRREVCRRLARLEIERGESEKGIATWKQGYEDPEGPQATRELAGFCESLGRDAEAVAIYEDQLKLSPEDSDLHWSLSRVCHRVRQHAKALEHLFLYLRSPRAVEPRANYEVDALLDADACGEDARIEAELQANPEDAELLFRGGLLDHWRGRGERAAERLRRVVAAEPLVMNARWWLALVQEGLGELREAAASAEALEELMARELRAGTNTNLQAYLTKLRRWRGELLLRAGDEAGARAVWKLPLPEPTNRLRAYRYSAYNSPNLNLRGYLKLLQDHHLDRAWREEMERIVLLSSNDVRAEDYVEALRRTGDRERARAVAWWKVFDPTARLVASPGGLNYGSGRQGHALIALYREDGDVAPLTARLRELLAKRPEHEGLLRLQELVFEGTGSDEELLALQRKKARNSPESAGPLEAVVATLVRLERYEEAIEQQERLIRSRLSEAVRDGWRDNSSSYFWQYDSAAREQEEGQRMLMALCMKAGRVQRAAALEARLRMGAPKGLADRLLGLAGYYARFDLVEPTERLCEEARVLKPELSRSVWGLLVTLYRRVGAGEKHARVRDQWLAAAAESMLSDPRAKYTSTQELGRASFILREGGDLDLALADAQRLCELEPRVASNRILLGWVLLKRGESEAAVAAFALGRQLRHENGETSLSDVELGLGLALAESGGEGWAKLLRRALALQPKHEAASVARARLATLEPARPERQLSPTKQDESKPPGENDPHAGDDPVGSDGHDE